MRIQKCKYLSKPAFFALVFTTCFSQGFGDTESPQDFSSSEDSIVFAWKNEKKCQPAQCQSYAIQPTIEFKTGYFFFSESKMRKVYNKGGLDLQIAGSYPVWRWLQIYGSVEYIERHGQSLNDHQKTRIWEYPISLGLKSVAKICEKTQYYFTIAPRYFFVHVHNNSPFMDRKMNQNGIGGFVGTGFNFLPTPHLLIDVFGEYSYCKLHFHTHKSNTTGRAVQVGGFAFGAGLGYAF